MKNKLQILLIALTAIFAASYFYAHGSALAFVGTAISLSIAFIVAALLLTLPFFHKSFDIKREDNISSSKLVAIILLAAIFFGSFMTVQFLFDKGVKNVLLSNGKQSEAKVSSRKTTTYGKAGLNSQLDLDISYDGHKANINIPTDDANYAKLAEESGSKTLSVYYLESLPFIVLPESSLK